jgi:hypothetical protein
MEATFMAYELLKGRRYEAVDRVPNPPNRARFVNAPEYRFAC